MKMERVVTISPGYRTILTRSSGLIRLAINAQIHDVVPTNGAVVDDDIPGPERDGVPFFQLEALFIHGAVADRWLGIDGVVGDLHVGHCGGYEGLNKRSCKDRVKLKNCCGVDVNNESKCE